MGLFDFLKPKKREEEAAPEELMRLDDVDPAAIRPPETRFTEEYKNFLESRAPGGEAAAPAEGGQAAQETDEDEI